ncbi:MAG TPA: FtsX-like permease family protein [Rariglobus sp.]|jgi:putative ABC transport system permease protein|nr:FtsX-like permease family protein [Rariglobus sp.]
MSTPLIALLLRRITLRHWRVAPRQSALLVVILSLGVAVFVSIRLANHAAVASFANFTDTLTGQSDWIIKAPAGTLPESVLPELRGALGGRPVNIIPVVEASASPPPSTDNENKFGRPTYTLLGVDLIAVSNLARAQDKPFFGQTIDTRTGTEKGGDFWKTFEAGPQVWVSRDFASTPPKTVQLVIDETVRTIPVAGIIPSAPDAPRAPADLFILGLAQLQKITGKTGFVDRVEFVVEPGPRIEQRRAELLQILQTAGRNGERWNVTAPGARREAAETMTRAFRLNLTILSLIALLVGLYLIFQALDGAVVRRRPEIAILRSLGVEESTIRRTWLAESALLGLAGGALGLLLGWVGAQASVRAVGQTVNALYYATTVKSANLTPVEAGIGLGIGLLAALIAGWWPAREAARTPPAQILQRGAAPAVGTRVMRSFVTGAVCVLAGVLCTRLPPVQFGGGSRFPFAGYAAAFLWIFGGGVLCAFLLPPLAHCARVFGERSAPVRVALSHLRKPSGRHRLATAALLCAIGMTAGMAILVASFDHTMKGWVRRTLQADLYISSGGAQSASAQNRISARAADAIARHPAVAHTGMLTAWPIEIGGVSTLLSGVDLANPATRPDLPWVNAPGDDAVFDSARNASLALVSESFTMRFAVKIGDQVQVPSPAGVHAMTIAGVFADYGNERGSILVDRRLAQTWFGDTSVTNISLYTKPGIDPGALRAELLKTYPGLAIFTNTKLRAEVLRIFRQTFSITYALEVIGVIVAVTGLGLTLVSVLLDRRDELTTLRALGFARREIALASSIEGLAVAVCAVIGGLLLSLALGWLLIHVINKQSFGWTLSYALPSGQLAALAALVIATGWIVSYAVGWWGADLPADRKE